MRETPQDDDGLLDRLQWETFEYFLKEVNPSNRLIADKPEWDQKLHRASRRRRKERRARVDVSERVGGLSEAGIATDARRL